MLGSYPCKFLSIEEPNDITNQVGEERKISREREREGGRDGFNRKM